MIEKEIFPYPGTVPDFLESPIKAFRWKRFFQGVTAIRYDEVKLFYKGFISEEEHYNMVREQNVDFGSKSINDFFGLEANEIGHDIF